MEKSKIHLVIQNLLKHASFGQKHPIMNTVGCKKTCLNSTTWFSLHYSSEGVTYQTQHKSVIKKPLQFSYFPQNYFTL